MKILLLFTATLHGLVPADHIELKAPSLPIGRWGNWTFCQKDTVARGFRLKVNFPWMNFFDRKGLTGIQLMCGDNSFANFANAPRSSFEKEGSEWQGVKMCPEGTYIQSFNLRQDEGFGYIFNDGQGATNLKVKCSDGSILFGDGIDTKGKYTGWLRCPNGYGISGIRTKLEDSSFFDNAGLVTVEMTCYTVNQVKDHPTTQISRANTHIAPPITNVFSIFSKYNTQPEPVVKNSTIQKDITAKAAVTYTIVAKPHRNNTVTPKESHNHTNSTVTIAAPVEIQSNATKKSESDKETKASTLHIITNYKDPYLNFPVFLEVIILIIAAIFFFIAGILCKKIYFVKCQEKNFQGRSKDNTEIINPVYFPEVKVSK